MQESMHENPQSSHLFLYILVFSVLVSELNTKKDESYIILGLHYVQIQ